jgi:uncharacterized protein
MPWLSMFLSYYTHIYSWPDDPEFRLFYSTLTSAKALIPVKTLHDIANNTVDRESTGTLLDLGFLTEDQNSEKQRAANMVQEINNLRQVMNISVILNLNCNFLCRYCYEGSQKSRRIMSKDTADQLITFIKKRFQPGMTQLTLDFYGGEPLLSVSLIKHIAGSLEPHIEELGAAFEFTLVTNGSLLTAKTVEQLLPVGLKRAKVTIDGPPENHNFFRPYRSGQPSFDTITNNVRKVVDLIQIGINGNFTKNNYKKFPDLFDHLSANNLTSEKLHSLSFSPVLQTNDEFSSGFCGGCASCNEEWLAGAAPLLREEILKRGYKTPEISPSLCMVDVDNSFVVHLDGSLYQCVAMIGHKDYSCGTIWDGIKNYQKRYSLNHWQKEEKCRVCTYLPLCFGGCRYMAFQRDGHMANVDCQKEYFDATLESYVKQDIQHQGQSS